MTHHKNAKVYGIEKNKDLSKVAKLACLFKNPNNQAKIFFQDALDHPAPAHKKDFQDFDLILSNPPYSVKGFLSTLDANVITSFTLGHKEIIDPKSYESNNAIECFFIERAQSWLKMGGVFALILPVSVLQKGGIYEKTRALLLDNFKILCIVELNSRTFGSTGTQTIILYAQRVQKFAQDLINALKEAGFESANLKEDFTQVGFLQEYCAFRGYPLEDFRAFLQTKNLSPYLKENLKDLSKLKEEQIHALELEKMLLFASVQEEEVLILKSPPEKKGNASNKAKIVEFLGYDWSKRKGDEGIKYASTQNADDPDNEALSNIQSAKHIVTPLYNPDPKNADDPTKLAHALKSFMGSLLANTPRPNLSVYTDQDPAGYQLFSTPLREMLDFSKAVLDRGINLNPKQEAVNPFEGGKWELVRLGELVSVADYVANGSFALLREKVQYLKQKNYAILVRLKDYSNGWSGDYVYVNKGAYDFLEKSKLNVGDIVMCNVGSLGICFKVPNLGQPMTLAPNSILIKPCVETIKNDFLFCIFKTDMFQQLIQTISSSMAQPKFNKTDFRNLKIPLPPLDIQEQIIAECTKVEKRAQELQEGIQNYQNLILAVLGVCGLSHTKETRALATDPKTKAYITNPRTRTYVTEGSQVAIMVQQSRKIEQILKTLATLKLELEPTDPKLEDLKNLVQDLPSPPVGGWEKISLSDPHKFSLSIGKRVLDSELSPQGTIPVYSANVSKPFGYVCHELLEDYDSDCVLWGIDGDWMTNYMPKDTPFYPTDHCGVLRPLDPNIKARVLCHALHQMGQEKGFCRNLRASLQRVKDLKIPLPPLPAQEQIVGVLTQIEQEIARLDAEIATLEGQEQEILKEFLGVTERERERERSQNLKIILDKLERAKALKESCLALLTHALEKAGLKPTLATLLDNLPTPPTSGWDLVKLGAHCLINQHSHNPNLESQEYRYIDIDCVEKGTGKIHLNPPIAGNQLPTRARRLAPADSVAISSVRPYLKGFAYIGQSIPNTLFSTGFAILQGKESLNSKFLYLLFMFSADLMRQMEERMPKASYPSLNTEDFKEFKIPLPPLPVQEQIVGVIAKIEQERTALENTLKSLKGQQEVILKKYLHPDT